MGCFSLQSRRKKEVTNSTKSVSYESSNSTLGGPSINKSGSELNSYTSTESSGKNTLQSISQRSSNLRVFSYQELKAATKGFSRSGRLGEGGFGYVYKGLVKCLENPSIKQEVAVKQLGKRGLQGHKEWLTEVNVLGVIEHPNLVKLHGYCADDDERGIQRLLVYEYMPNGSVEDHLTTRATTTLSWPMRLRIAQDAARGLAYLHEGMEFQWNAKLSDFGLARFGPADGKTHVSTAAVGTMGYAAPEYVRTGRLTSKSDVWSYGVFLYELITGRRPIDKNQPKSEQNLLQWVKPYLSNKSKFEVIVDPRLGKDYSVKSVHKLSLVANQCLIPHHRSRPKMTEILRMVTELVESSSDLGRPEVVLARNPEERVASEDKNGKRRRSSSSGRGDVGWLARIWRRRVV